MAPEDGRCLRRFPSCSKCRNHGHIVALKGHKRFCPRRTCTCERCTLTNERQRILAAHLAIRRKEHHNPCPNVVVVGDPATRTQLTQQDSLHPMQGGGERKPHLLPVSAAHSTKPSTFHYTGELALSMDVTVTNQENYGATDESNLCTKVTKNEQKQPFFVNNLGLCRLPAVDSGVRPPYNVQHLSQANVPLSSEPAAYRRPPYFPEVSLFGNEHTRMNGASSDQYQIHPSLYSCHSRCMKVLLRHFTGLPYAFLESVLLEQRGDLLSTMEKLILMSEMYRSAATSYAPQTTLLSSENLNHYSPHSDDGVSVVPESYASSKELTKNDKLELTKETLETPTLSPCLPASTNIDTKSPLQEVPNNTLAERRICLSTESAETRTHGNETSDDKGKHVTQRKEISSQKSSYNEDDSPINVLDEKPGGYRHPSHPNMKIRSPDVLLKDNISNLQCKKDKDQEDTSVAIT